ncbi:MAG: hypothetical protein NTW11_02650 [Candidatus Staskawiczbacteria bacterium]|nr:hypothetical protein [Candidatus Staskawiczbacteria bacterium]
MQNETKVCQNCKKDFVIEPDDFAFYGKMKVPAPVNCPRCRFQWRALWRNEMYLYSRKCQLCGKSIVAMYHPDSPYTVYCQDCWLSDKWDPMEYGKDYDPKRPFFEQMGELLKKVPKAGTFASEDIGPNINSEFTNFAGGNKDCYFIFNSGPNNENCSYSRGLAHCKDLFDGYYSDKTEGGYEIINTHNSSNVIFSQNTNDCMDSWYLYSCSGCQNCFGCVNLRHKSYHFLNQPLSKEDYEKRIEEIKGSYVKMEAFRKEFEELLIKQSHRENNNLKSANSSGEYVFESKNCHDSFEVSFSEDSRYLFSNKYVKDCYDLIGHGRRSELLLSNVAVGTSRNVIGSWWTTTSHDLFYVFGLRSCEDCFGCDSLKNARYCILNKQYSEEEYRQITGKIISELKEKNLFGLYFPPSIAPFAYNETIAQDNYPLTKEEVLNLGYRWQDNFQMTKGKETIKIGEIPDNINDIQDSIVKEILACEVCGRNYKIIQQEFQFYRKMILPLPHKCFFCRHKDRLTRRGPMTIYNRQCAKCSRDIKTTYAPDRPEIVYCESCYQNEVA